MIEETVARILLGDSPAMRMLRRAIVRLGPSPLPVMIEGPTGSGKELVAQALHATSGRSGELVAFNICAIAESIFEDALFGHVRGAFTGALAPLDGYLAQAHRGTVFLDEIAGLAANLQIKLLRAIETKSFRPVGARCDHHSDFRLLTATNEPIVDLLEKGRIRSDLAERLCGFVLPVPSLAQRAEDIPSLAHHFLEQWGREHGHEPPVITSGAIAVLREYHWPRNVRELRNVIARSATLVDGGVMRAEDVRLGMEPPRRAVGSAQDAFVQRRLLTVLSECNGDTAAAAQQLGMHRATLYRRLRRLGLPCRPADLVRQPQSDQSAVKGPPQDGCPGYAIPFEGDCEPIREV